MLIGKPNDIPSSEITPKDVYVRRREFIGRTARGLVVAAAAPSALLACDSANGESARGGPAEDGSGAAIQEELTPYEHVTTYNNFYEFGTGKEDPSELAHMFNPKPWTVEIGGLVDRPGEYHLEDFLKPHTVEDRTYRLRCVEAWSMVIPWRGIPLADVLKRAEPRPGAEFVRFTTVFRPSEMPGQRRPILDWPYVEGLRLDEAMHPLTILATGLYGEELPNQNGAPLRLVVPWKYGFKSIKSIVRIELIDHMPVNTWKQMQPSEYGFYANVNPNVDHPRWSQARERRIGEFGRRPTLMFNGYADQVAHLYEGMDLEKWY
ncbi:MAG: protein-methionine-sulfoxide reductase catalytic subunit MsrP [Longimicrobiales bacterium]|nr:protein-methionine-sulfoxide reductase catalytic subunit MsrP [Longimicrobiales bacterium]